MPESPPVDGEVHAEGNRPPAQIGDFTVIDGRRYRIVYSAHGDYVRTDKKGDVIRGIGFLGVVPE